jgi:hypothetical protein
MIEMQPEDEPCLSEASARELSRIVKKRILESSKDKDVRLVPEMQICGGTARVDFALLNGLLHGYEIKGSLDNLTRLPNQAKAYNQVFNRITIIVAPNHLEKTLDIVPSWWEIQQFVESEVGIDIVPLRSGYLNPKPNPFEIARLLWKDEAREALELFEKGPNLQRKTRASLVSQLATELPSCAVRQYVCTQLKLRQSWRAGQAHR